MLRALKIHLIKVIPIVCMLIVVLVITSCSEVVNNKENDSSLISWTSDFEMAAGELTMAYYSDRSAFIKPYCQKMYSGDTLYVSTLHEVNSCGEYIGFIKYSGDTLFLLKKIIGDEVCTSNEFHKFSYTIVKENIEKYNVVW